MRATSGEEAASEDVSESQVRLMRHRSMPFIGAQQQALAHIAQRPPAAASGGPAIAPAKAASRMVVRMRRSTLGDLVRLNE